MKTFLASSLALFCATVSLVSPAEAGRPTGNTITNPGSPVSPPVPRPSQKVVGQNSGILATPTATKPSTVLTGTTVVRPSSDPQ
jgi:hypothetical protein